MTSPGSGNKWWNKWCIKLEETSRGSSCLCSDIGVYICRLQGCKFPEYTAQRLRFWDTKISSSALASVLYDMAEDVSSCSNLCGDKDRKGLLTTSPCQPFIPSKWFLNYPFHSSILKFAIFLLKIIEDLPCARNSGFQHKYNISLPLKVWVHGLSLAFA